MRNALLQDSAAPRTCSKKLLVLVLLPVLAYAAVMVLSVRQRDPVAFVGTDLALLIGILTYCCVGVWLATCRPVMQAVRFLACVYSTLITLAITETALRLVQPPLVDSPMPRIHSVYSPSADLPGITGPIEFTVNKLGVRGPELRLEDVALRILCVGGSTTECMYQTDKSSWPWLLQDKLAAQLGKPVLVGNAGRSGHITLNHDYLLKHYPLAPHFEWVVLFCGWNDMIGMMSLRNYETRKATAAELTLYNPSSTNHRTLYRDLALLQRLHERFGRIPRPPGIRQDTAGYWMEEQRRKRQEALKRRTITNVPADELQEALTIYRENVEHIIQTCRKHGQRLVVMNQPTIYRKDLPDNLERLTWSYRRDGALATPLLEQLMAAFNRATCEVCANQGVDCINLAAALPRDGSMFFDDVHLTNAGCELVADLACNYFVTKLLDSERTY